MSIFIPQGAACGWLPAPGVSGSLTGEEGTLRAATTIPATARKRPVSSIMGHILGNSHSTPDIRIHRGNVTG